MIRVSHRPTATSTAAGWVYGVAFLTTARTTRRFSRRRVETLINMALQQGISELHSRLFVLLQRNNEQTRTSLLDEIDKKAILAFTLVALNVILSTISTDEQQLEELCRHRDQSREVVERKGCG